MKQQFDFEDLATAALVECGWWGGDGVPKTYHAEVLEVGPHHVTLRSSRGKVFTRPLPTSVILRVIARR